MRREGISRSEGLTVYLRGLKTNLLFNARRLMHLDWPTKVLIGTGDTRCLECTGLN
jgi:hypothetical protein